MDLDLGSWWSISRCLAARSPLVLRSLIAPAFDRGFSRLRQRLCQDFNYRSLEPIRFFFVAGTLGWGFAGLSQLLREDLGCFGGFRVLWCAVVCFGELRGALGSFGVLGYASGGSLSTALNICSLRGAISSSFSFFTFPNTHVSFGHSRGLESQTRGNTGRQLASLLLTLFPAKGAAHCSLPLRDLGFPK